VVFFVQGLGTTLEGFNVVHYANESGVTIWLEVNPSLSEQIT
jgi:hypothetical protein